MILLLALIGFAIIAVWGANILLRPYRPSNPKVTFTVLPGEDFSAIQARLVKSRLIPNSPWIALWARYKGWDRNLRAGRYEIDPSMPPAEIFRTFVEGPRVLLKVTLPEGWRSADGIQRLEESLECDPGSLYKIARDSTWLLSLGLPAPNVEGYLFPETYFFDPGTTGHEILRHILLKTIEYFNLERGARLRELGMTLHEAVTLASIIEAEAKLPEERVRISAVFHNRLREGWPLQADPTVLFAVGKSGEPPLTEDLESPSPYNTYLVQGLPPGPINSPGAAALEAALYPLPHCREFFFVARPDGSHIFSRTLHEHEEARRRLKHSKG
ncbi:MAG: endolytic transglycosylase MltG [Candidatus Eisenbacteria bacterium]|uniref:Endolytic murein transglycosylase n=1 Tax=Eiseniibacteriota bacterium TaxID=2212470 RepID=A0A948S0B0_UNCEI|nr:endolytic transglycosylase MltG [Candidatus Eisenbacteria bacterium]MBU1948435.1 endolytic transglycosylase MltG [Candidatus Eisenbacteria bacterium]MBU2692912.1 endolytic transglycosylase MltG [Candidatus Eisenbacteria bacterium]